MLIHFGDVFFESSGMDMDAPPRISAQGIQVVHIFMSRPSSFFFFSMGGFAGMYLNI